MRCLYPGRLWWWGGGGGSGTDGGGSNPPVAFTSFTAVSASSSVKLDGGSQQTSYAGSLDATNSSGSNAKTSASLTLTYDAQTTLSAATISPVGLTALTWSKANSDSIDSAATAGDLNVTTLTSQDRNKILNLARSDSNYQTFGTWITGFRARDGDLGAFSVGAATASASLPTSGTVTYKGYALGYVAELRVSSVMTITVNFTPDIQGRREVNFSTTDSKTFTNAGWRPEDALNLNGTLYLDSNNQIAGQIRVTTLNGGGNAGSVSGRTYGPLAAEIGGTLSILWDPNKTYTAAFGGKKQP